MRNFPFNLSSSKGVSLPQYAERRSLLIARKNNSMKNQFLIFLLHPNQTTHLCFLWNVFLFFSCIPEFFNIPFYISEFSVIIKVGYIRPVKHPDNYVGFVFFDIIEQGHIPVMSHIHRVHFIAAYIRNGFNCVCKACTVD